MYTDFESILEPIESPNPDPKQPYSQNVHQHVSTGWCVYSKFVYVALYIILSRDYMVSFDLTKSPAV